MFEVHGVYANRKSKYTVLAINGPKMSVQYEDGTHADLNMRVQARIWENILAEQEAQQAKEASRLASRLARQGVGQTRFFIKAVSIPDPTEYLFPGWQEQVIMSPSDKTMEVKVGTRLIYYAIELQIFFAVATITGEPFSADPKKYFFTSELQKADFFSVDMDAAASVLEHGVRADSIDLESCPQFKTKSLAPEAFLEINEDDFELLSELLTEVSEEEADVIDDEDEYEEEDEE